MQLRKLNGPVIDSVRIAHEPLHQPYRRFTERGWKTVGRLELQSFSAELQYPVPELGDGRVANAI